MECARCNGLGVLSHPNPAWTPKTPREATETTGPHGRPLTPCECTLTTQEETKP